MNIKNFKFPLIILLISIMFITILAFTPQEYRRFTNLRLKGWVFGDDTWRGQQSWQKAGTVDTLVISGLDRNCYIFLQADSLTCKAPLYVFDISSDGDTALIKCDSTLTTDFDYNYMVIR